MRVLLLEDDHTLGEALRDHVVSEAHAVDWFKTITEASGAVQAVRYDLMLFDLRLPDGDGLSFLRNVRLRDVSAPIIVLTARDQISDRIESLNAGADDYLVKPFDLGELSARIRAVTRRYEGRHASLIRIGDIAIDQTARLVNVNGQELVLSAREWAVLDRLVERPGAIVSRAQLFDVLYDLGSEVESNTVEVYVSRLRKKIGRNRIETVRGVGYVLRSD